MIRENFDSDEEFHFYHWILEAEKFGLVKGWDYHDEVFHLSEPVKIDIEKKLKTKTKIVSKHLLNGHVYTPDFSIFFVKRLPDILKVFEFPPLPSYPNYPFIYVDVKGEFGGKYHSDREFSINRKWLWQRCGIYVHKIVPKTFFKKTWVPEAVAWMKNRKVPTRRKSYKSCKLYRELTK